MIRSQPPHLRKDWFLLEALLSRVFNRLGSLCRGLRTGENGLNGIIQGRTHGRRQILIVVQLEVCRSRKILLDGDHIGVGQARFAAFDHGDGYTRCGELRLCGRAGQELDEVNRFRWGILANCESIATTYHIGSSTNPAFDGREIEQAEISPDTFLSLLWPAEAVGPH